MQFEHCMLWLREWFTVLPLDDAARRLRSNTLPSRALAITFDDGYADNATIAAPILSRLGLTATFFVCPGFLDGGRMWNDDVIESIRALKAAVVDLSCMRLGFMSIRTTVERRFAIDRILASIKHLPYEDRAACVERLLVQSDGRQGPELMMTREQVGQLRRAGMAVGGHTVKHPILTRLPANRARDEIAQGKEQLEAIIGERLTCFAYPNGVPGLDFTAEHVEMVRSCGFECAVSTAWGVAVQSSDPFQLPRFTPWDKSRMKFGLRMARNLLHTDFVTV